MRAELPDTGVEVRLSVGVTVGATEGDAEHADSRSAAHVLAQELHTCALEDPHHTHAVAMRSLQIGVTTMPHEVQSAHSSLEGISCSTPSMYTQAGAGDVQFAPAPQLMPAAHQRGAPLAPSQPGEDVEARQAETQRPSSAPMEGVGVRVGEVLDTGEPELDAVPVGVPLEGVGVLVPVGPGVPLRAKYPAGQAEHAAAPLAE